MPGAFDIVMEQRRALVEKITAMMRQGKFFNNAAEWDRERLRPHNPLSRAVYRGGNRLRLMWAVLEKGYTDPRWATLRQYREKGYYPKKGEHGILCEKWIFTKEVIRTDENGRKIRETEELEHPAVAYFTVFNAGQIQGFPQYRAPERAQETQVTALMDDFMAASECRIRELAQERAFYSPARDEIVLPLREFFKDDTSFAKTVLHEMAHSTGHPTRLDRNLSGGYGSPEYAREELRAEISALFMGADLGLPLTGEHYEDHSDYLLSWTGVLQEDYNELFRACADAEKIAARLEGNYERSRGCSLMPVMEEVPPAEKRTRHMEKASCSL
ncbi:ArdC family protein [Marvinbryantia formatexigens]|nr:zincin-like metallopeptidase domain-containing protein [Marvinbryantia formatexigens]UWO25025.1 zincin-like metallopeptidase domain-containing protein [Marvinbryantia formatexigens DSM 14469]SDG27850.1 Antirestriction protein ArdC [Marvinbryantia formatexigens]